MGTLRSPESPSIKKGSQTWNELKLEEKKGVEHKQDNSSARGAEELSCLSHVTSR